ncbi:ISAs1 family transposase [Chromobacterium alticapitis]|uniref:ISAs1 family transposase n=1 Tax=Chromobacterium alticapitis TaxID=2073169 RepID=A0A2S5DEA4_9NEIS|nr:ISAs1 family transposase [Chromobacterium alticapitis]
MAPNTELGHSHFEAAFRDWTQGLQGAFQQIAIDGKCLRGIARGQHGPVHMVSAFATELGLALGQEKVADKSNEITAITALLNALDVKGCLVILDAMGCQKDVAKTIVERQADYLLAVKDNQPKLRQAAACALMDRPGERVTGAQKGHGRTVLQHVVIAPAEDFVDEAAWPGGKTVGRVDSVRLDGSGQPVVEQRYYLSSRELGAEALAQAVRRHWAIENSLHWCFDVIFHEDQCLLRKDHGPQNFALLLKFALNLLRSSPFQAKKSMRVRRKRAGCDDGQGNRTYLTYQVCRRSFCPQQPDWHSAGSGMRAHLFKI